MVTLPIIRNLKERYPNTNIEIKDPLVEPFCILHQLPSILLGGGPKTHCDRQTDRQRCIDRWIDLLIPFVAVPHTQS